MAGYQRLEDEFESYNVHPLAGYVIGVLASVAVVVACSWKAAVLYRARNP